MDGLTQQPALRECMGTDRRSRLLYGSSDDGFFIVDSLLVHPSLELLADAAS